MSNRYTIARQVAEQFTADLVARGETLLYSEALPRNRNLIYIVTLDPAETPEALATPDPPAPVADWPAPNRKGKFHGDLQTSWTPMVIIRVPKCGQSDDWGDWRCDKIAFHDHPEHSMTVTWRDDEDDL